MTVNYHTVNDKYHIFSDTAASFDDKGFTFSVSDDIAARPFFATAGSKILDGYRPVFDATAVSRLRNEGGSLIGTTNMDEFGFGLFSVTGSDIPKNPFDTGRSCGGSSGGAACAASLFKGHAALGTSAGGSVSSPAAFCGVFGITPTHGRVSRYGQIESVSSMGPIGMLASRSETLREYFPIISGKDDKDPITAAQPKLRTGRKMRSVAVPKDATDGVSDAVRKAFDDSVGMLKDMSVDVEYVDMPCLRYAVPAHYILHAVEAATNLSRYCGLRYGRQDGDLSLPFNEYFVSIRTKYFGFESKVKAIMGAYMTLGDNRKTFYLRSLGIRKLAIDSYRDILERHDAVLTPSMPFIAPTFDDISEMNSSDVYNAGRFVVPPVFCGLPCISVPCGYSGGMPIGMQLVSGRWNEDVLLSAAEMWEKAFKVRHPEASV